MTNEQRAKELFNSGYSCAQSVYLACRDESLMSRQAATLASGAFAGGVGTMEQSCGALCGAMMVLSERFLPEHPSDLEQSQRAFHIMKAFGQWFKKEYQTCMCRELKAMTPYGQSTRAACVKYVAGCAKKLGAAKAPFACRRIDYGSSDYESALDLRQAVLRDPLGLNLRDEDLSHEKDCIHFGAHIVDELVATLYVQPRDAHNIQLRQVAVRENYQRLGAGRLLINLAEDYARQNGYDTMLAHARKSAQAVLRDVGLPFDREFGRNPRPSPCVHGKGASRLNRPAQWWAASLIDCRLCGMWYTV